MSNQPIVFNIQYTPYSLPRSATAEERERHTDERAFFDMTGGKNVFDYITTEGKRTGKRTALEYLQKNTGVFNDRGMIPQEQVIEMKARLKENYLAQRRGIAEDRHARKVRRTHQADVSLVPERRETPPRQH